MNSCVRYGVRHFSMLVGYLKADRVLTRLLISSAKSVSEKKKCF